MPAFADVHALEPPHVRHVLVAGEHDLHAGVDEHLEQVAGIHHGASLATRAGDRQQVMVQHEHLQLRGLLELTADPVVVHATDLALVQIRLARVDPDDANALDVVRPHAGADQILEMQVADVAGVVVARNGDHGGLDALGVSDPVLVFLPIALGGEISAHHDDVGPELVELGDHPVHEVGHEVLGADVWIRDVGDRDHGWHQSSGRA